MDELDEIRREIDSIDRSIVELYERRTEMTDRVAEYKIRTGKKVLDSTREKQKLSALEQITVNPDNRQAVHELFEQIMAMSRKKQYQRIMEAGNVSSLPFIPVETLVRENMRVVYQGAPGSYSEAAMKTYFGRDVNCFAVESFRDAMTAIEEGTADYAVLPIENSTAGIVNQIYDLLAEYENYIVAEVIIPIRHCLMACPGTTMESIQRVYSHAQSLMQSERFLRDMPWQQISVGNNAFAARKVADEQDVTQAAIASRYAAETYGLEILKEGVNQSDTNSTRFIICTNQKIFRADAAKISLCFEVTNETGSLYHILSHFIYNNLNMTKIESRPIAERNWEYRFFLDFEGNLKDSGVRNALRGVRDEARNLRILGNY